MSKQNILNSLNVEMTGLLYLFAIDCTGVVKAALSAYGHPKITNYKAPQCDISFITKAKSKPKKQNTLPHC